MVSSAPLASGSTAHPLQADVQAFIESLLTDTAIASSLGHHHGKQAVLGPAGGGPVAGTDVESPSTSTALASHFIIAASTTPNFLHAVTHPPPSAPLSSAPVAFLHRAPPSSLRASLSPSILLSNHAAVTSHLSLSYNIALASDFGIIPTSVLPLPDPSRHRASQAIGLVGRIDPAEAAGYRFQTPQLRFRLLEMAGPNAPVVNRISDVMQLCVGVSEEGAIGVFDYSREQVGSAVRLGRPVKSRDGDLLEEEDEDEEQEEDESGARSRVESLPQVSASNGKTGVQDDSIAPTVTAIVISRTFDAQTVDQAHALATKAGYLADSNATLLFVTAQPRQKGLDAARKHKMLVMCVTSVAASWWALRYIGRKVQERWPDLEVREVRK